MKKGTVIAGISVLSFITGFFLGGKMLVEMINEYKEQTNRNLSNMLIMNNWLNFIYSGGKISEFFYRNQYNKIMIYGGGYIGIRLAQALSNTDIDVVAIMDKKVLYNEDISVIGIDASIPDVDCIVITPVYYYNEITDMLQKKTTIPMISIQLIWEST
jgi:hypothetical protein